MNCKGQFIAITIPCENVKCGLNACKYFILGMSEFCSNFPQENAVMSKFHFTCQYVLTSLFSDVQSVQNELLAPLDLITNSILRRGHYLKSQLIGSSTHPQNYARLLTGWSVKLRPAPTLLLICYSSVQLFNFRTTHRYKRKLYRGNHEIAAAYCLN